ncbi:hypothetical protein QTP88_001269 [Uroleucon formosanum]
MSIFWGDLLGCFNAISKKLQSIDIDLYLVVELYESYIQYISNLRNEKMFKMYEDRTSKLHGERNCYPINRMTEEITSYIEKTGVIAQITDVLKLFEALLLPEINDITESENLITENLDATPEPSNINESTLTFCIEDNDTSVRSDPSFIWNSPSTSR